MSNQIVRLSLDCQIVLTISTHASGDALLEPAVLTSVAVDSLDRALLVLRARAVLDLLLDRPAEEALQDDQSDTISGWRGFKRNVVR